MSCSVYSITHVQTGREYVGVTSGKPRDRWARHKLDARSGRGHRLHRAMRKYGETAFAFKIEAVLPTKAEAWLAERIAVALRQPAFNLTRGGEGTPGWQHSAETRAKISGALLSSEKLKLASARHAEARRGVPLTPAHCASLKAAHRGFKGRKHSEATKQKLRDAALRRVVPRATIEASARARTGRPLSESHKQAVSAGMRGRCVSAETRAKIGAANRAVWARKRACR
jgi:group I intron endonuclease